MANITAEHLLLAIISGFVWELVMNEWLFLGLGCDNLICHYKVEKLIPLKYNTNPMENSTPKC